MPEGKLEKTITIVSSDVDRYQRLRMSALFRYLQELSILDTEKEGVTRDKTLDKGLLWVIARMRVELKRPILYDETITLRTWPEAMRHMLFPRQYDAVDAKGNVIAQGCAIWLLIDQKSRSMVMPNTYDISIAGRPMEREMHLLSSFPKIEGEKNRVEREVVYSEIDLNGHVNNTRYLDWIDDLFTMEQHASLYVQKIQIDYKKEASFGSLLELEQISDGSQSLITGREAGKEVFTAFAETGEI